MRRCVDRHSCTDLGHCARTFFVVRAGLLLLLLFLRAAPNRWQRTRVSRLRSTIAMAGPLHACHPVGIEARASGLALFECFGFCCCFCLESLAARGVARRCGTDPERAAVFAFVLAVTFYSSLPNGAAFLSIAAHARSGATTQDTRGKVEREESSAGR